MKTRFTKNILLFLLSLFIYDAQSQTKPKLIEIISSKTLTFLDTPAKHYQLVDSVHLRHDSTELYCDSAVFFTEKNTFEAYGNVLLERGDSIELTCDSLIYYGDDSFAKAKSNVFLRKDTVNLYSNFVEYYIDEQKASYKNYGKIINVKDTLDSALGLYEFNKNKITLTKNVYSRNEDIKCYSQYLNYNTLTKYLDLKDQVNILTDSSTVYLDKANYNNQTRKIIGQGHIKALYQNYIVFSDSIQMHTIDSVLWAWDNVHVIDTLENIELKSEYTELYKQSEKGFFVDSVYMMQIDELDTLYLYADTIYMDRSNNKTIIDGYRDVKIWKKDLQSIADSIHYNQFTDKITLSKNPIAWMDEQQMTADTIEIQLKNKDLDSLFFIGHAFMITEEDVPSDLYSQVKGRRIDVNVDNQVLKSALVNGNAEILYCMFEKEKFSGVNTMNGSKLNIIFENKEISKVIYLSIIDGTYVPSQKITKKNRFLSSFKLYSHKKIYKSDFQVF